jgi:hypothetical protein
LHASQRKRKNKITHLQNSDGEVTEDPGIMASSTNEFYHNLYTSEGTEEMDVVLDSVPVRVRRDMNEGLLATIMNKEVRYALF